MRAYAEGSWVRCSGSDQTQTAEGLTPNHLPGEGVQRWISERERVRQSVRARAQCKNIHVFSIAEYVITHNEDTVCINMLY